MDVSELDGKGTFFHNDTIATDNTTEMSTIKPDHEHSVHDLSYLLLPLCSIVIIAFLTVTVIILLKRKRRIDRLRHHLMPYYNFAPGEEDDWETELLESEGEISARRDYNTVSFSKELPPQEK